MKEALLTPEIVGDFCLKPGPLFDAWKRNWLVSQGLDPNRAFVARVTDEGILYKEMTR